MNTLFTFGCSYTQDYHDENPNYLEYKKFHNGTFPKTWPTLLSEKLGYRLENYGISAAGNQTIFTCFCQNCNKPKKGDIVIIEWSFIERYRVADSTGKWLMYGLSINDNKIFSKECHEKIIINRTSRLYIDEIYDFEKILDKISELVGFEIYYWTPINDLIYNLPKEILNQKKYLLHDMVKDLTDNVFQIVLKNGGQWIYEETNNQINDNHMGKKGHEVQSKLFYEHIIKYKN